MFVSDIPSFSVWLAKSPIRDDRIWSRPLEDISENEIQLFYARAGLQGFKKEATDAIGQLQDEILLQSMCKDMPQKALRIVSHQTPINRFATDEFLDHLAKIGVERRSAILYALVTRQEPEDVAELCWKNVRELGQLPELAQEILAMRSKIRHLKLPYVFWEWATLRIASPLLILQQTAEDAFGMAWPAIQVRWDEMIWINTGAEKCDFLELVEEVASGQL